MPGTAAIFVDAGYFFAQGSYAKEGRSTKRVDLRLDVAPFVAAFLAWVSARLPQDSSILRTYWYDGARDGVCTPEQLRIGATSHVKLRVGRINGQGQQKGVDTLIVRDLMVLSQERSISHAVVLSGDEDLREGIEYAQDRGVTVLVLGIEGKRGSSQSRELVREADESLQLDPKLLEHLTVGSPPLPDIDAEAVEPSEQLSASESSAAFAQEWAARHDAEAVADVASKTQVPRPIDVQLLKHVEGELGVSLMGDESKRREVRRSFSETMRLIASRADEIDNEVDGD